MEEVVSNINWAVIAPLLVIQFILLVVALIDWIRIRETNGPKWLWLIIILFVGTLGPVLYFIIGRKNE
ncbi:PLD nuclease N-terminal domain-containing protein [Virgibacillus sp. MSJ-26]|uniref:PLD nuclease N-terminal domain-containing protein n=1 Tax=Virgibacillus sp. MSJ-26 TaxID=2841522 RepID=UPI001C0F8AAF|nr:PLD nuclease N-terminal domain-containing protein [Virgibacillus sp. MSJ-26]MBU5468154.1 PLD nuclease N-terminal domain-containing protein [Virgibacillus sp. MSJ-26]